MAALDAETDRRRAPGPIQAPDRPGLDAHDARARALEVPRGSEPLHAGRGRPLKRNAVEDDLRSSPLLRGRHEHARRLRRGRDDQESCDSQADRER